jgi:cytochrome c
MSCTPTTLFCAAALTVCAASASAQSGNAGKGESLFASNCAECHSLKEGKDKKGPSLHGIVGAKAGQRPDYKYSDTLRASQLVWNAENLSRSLANPRAVVPDGSMNSDTAVTDAQERADLIAYLSTHGGR